MALTPYSDIPKSLFLIRMVLPCVLLFILFFLCVGVIANSGEFQGNSGPSAVVPFWIAAFRHYHVFISNISQIPEVCWSGRAVNEFQSHQCDVYWENLTKSGGLATVPFVLVAVFIFISFDNFKSVYRRVHKRIEKGNAAFGGTVTNPPEGAEDVFSWVYCLRPVMIELANKQQIKVYVPLSMPTPSPGQTLALFEPFHSFGEKRHCGMVYAPHVAVVRGA